MATLTISVSDQAMARLRSRAVREGYADPEAFVRSLVADELEADAVLADAAAPEHLKVTSREQFVALLREGAAGPKREMTQADFAQLRTEIIARAPGAKAG